MAAKNLPVVAAFDFDKTLTYGDTLVPYAISSIGLAATMFAVGKQLPQLAKFYFDRSQRQQTKEEFLTYCFAGKPLAEMFQTGELFAKHKLPKLLRPQAMERLRWHQMNKHRTILISANLDVYLSPWVKLAGIDDLICSCVAQNEEGLATGKLSGLNCWGKEKTRRLNELLGPKQNYVLYAYGDSQGDEELLAMADYPHYRTFVQP